MNHTRGFSLIEVIAAMVVLTVGVLGFASSVQAVSQLGTEGGRMAEATVIADTELEVLRASGCASLAGGSATAADGYSLSWTVTPAASFAQVALVVSYSTGRRINSTRFVTYIACTHA